MKLQGLNLMFSTQERYDKIKTLLSHYWIPKKLRVFSLNDNGDVILTKENMVVVPRDKVQEKIKEIYENDTNALGKGINGLYKYIGSKYIGIMRKDVEEFLKTQTTYQVTSDINKVVNKPLISYRPNSNYHIDLIDLDRYSSSNNNIRYLLNVVDLFSRKLWIRKIKNKTPINVKNAFISIYEETGVLPDTITSDNGGEFKGEFNEWVKSKGIKHHFNTTYSPNQNIAERYNKEIQKVLRAFFVENGNLRWTNLLDKVEDNLNNKYISTIKATPNDVWSPSKNEITKKNKKNNEQYEAQFNIKNQAERRVAKYENKEFEVGDIVRVKMSSLFSDIRRIIKEGNSKQLVVTYSPVLYEILSKSNTRNKLQRPRYILGNAEGKLTKPNGETKEFFSADLINSNNITDNNKMTDDKALKLNQSKRTANDIVIMA
jgi:hypothetical protein